jgi:hypothetical protein
MAASTRPTIVAIVGFFALAYASGLVLGALALLWHVSFRDGLPQMTWWQWLLAPLGIGLLSIGGEWVVQKLQDITGFGAVGQTRGKRVLHLLILFLVLALLILGPAFYNIAHP